MSNPRTTQIDQNNPATNIRSITAVWNQKSSSATAFRAGDCLFFLMLMLIILNH